MVRADRELERCTGKGFWESEGSKGRANLVSIVSQVVGHRRVQQECAHIVGDLKQGDVVGITKWVSGSRSQREDTY